VYTYTYMYVYTYIYTYSVFGVEHIYTYMYMYIYVYTYMYMCMSLHLSPNLTWHCAHRGETSSMTIQYMCKRLPPVLEKIQLKIGITMEMRIRIDCYRSLFNRFHSFIHWKDMLHFVVFDCDFHSGDHFESRLRGNVLSIVIVDL